MRLLDEFNIDNVCWESDYPHSDSSWPNSPEHLEALFADLDDATINKITHENAMRHFQFDPFATFGRVSSARRRRCGRRPPTSTP